ncbi:N-acetyltransferase [Adlercreutzia sp. ZJ154]|uniref:GNAT family N-acetyltransferase n=1 Tax=Adlercreutzia sp. ZJ154 TaxID=2709790 RepID=UPI0013E9C362|nr:N-acetyltransferase [Adlercreutzia sp. ZJ154]
MVEVREIRSDERGKIGEIVAIHLEAFPGFFLTFMGNGFLRQLYSSYCDHADSGLLVAEKDGKLLGFLAFSTNYSEFFKYMIRTRLVAFAWYSVGALIRRPSAFARIAAAFLKPSEVKREEKYVELSSIGVSPAFNSRGIGSRLIDELKNRTDFNLYDYITLETDSIDNDAAIHFYEKNGFVKHREFYSNKNRKMIEFRFYNANS